MSAHPLIELANDASVKQVGSFREAADALTGAQLADMYRQEKETAIEEAAGAELAHFLEHENTNENAIVVDEHELALAVLNQCQLDNVNLKLLDGVAIQDPDDADDDGTPPTELTLLDYELAATTLKPRKIKARNRVISQFDMIGVTSTERLAVVRTRMMPAKSTKGDTPLRALLEGLAQTAVADAWKDSLAAQISEKFDRTISSDPPMLMVLANNRYWEIYRKRSLKSAGPWMAAMKRVNAEIESALNIPVVTSSIKLYGDPPWRVRGGKLILDAAPKLRSGLDPVGDELRPKNKSRSGADENVVVEADMDRAPVPYSVRDLYYPGDRLAHPKLGEGVVQRQLGPNKVDVKFDGENKVLVMGRS